MGPMYDTPKRIQDMKVTLVLMVRNEAKTIEDTLKSWLPIADNVVVVDTGSEDGTVDRMGEVLRQWPPGFQNGRMFERSWIDFATNRNQCLALAANEFPGTWLVMVDADTRLHGGEKLRTYLLSTPPVSGPDSFKLRTMCGNLSYPMHRIFLAGSGWVFAGAVHEAPVYCGVNYPDSFCGEKNQHEPGPTIPGCWQEYVGTDRKEKPSAWRQHLATLLSQEQPSARDLHYIAQTYACLGENDMAAQYYDLRWCRRDGYEPERWRAGLCYARLWWNENVSPMPLLRELARLRPWRAEPWFELASRYLDHCKDPHKALAYARMAASLPVPENDEYMIEVDIYEWRADLLMARCLEAVGDRLRAQVVYAHLQDTRLPNAEKLYVEQRIAVLSGHRGG